MTRKPICPGCGRPVVGDFDHTVAHYGGRTYTWHGECWRRKRLKDIGLQGYTATRRSTPPPKTPRAPVK